jgi:hypothetical protein
VSVCVLAKYTAKSLLGNGTNGWNDQLVQYIFLSHDAKEILNMRTASYDLKDNVAWKDGQRRAFLVSKGAYRLATTLNKVAPKASSNAPYGRIRY